jgi:predicted MPP superfamily phosphohydrolase
MGLKNSTCKRIFLACQALFLPPLFVYTAFIEPQWLRVREITLGAKDNRLMKALTGVRALHISDLHINKIGRRECKALDAICALSPDIVFITGDYLDYSGQTAVAMEFLDRIEAPGGVYGVLGNVDYENPRHAQVLYDRYRRGPEPRRSLVILKNEAVTINPAGSPVQVVGIEDPVIYESKEEYLETISAFFDKIDKTKPILLLSHRPDVYEWAPDRDVGLALCGHTHGGQMRLPFSLQFYNQSEACKTYSRGLYRVGKMPMHVSPGVGTSDISMRFLCRPEVTLLHFV